MTCSSCGRVNAAEARFCDSCGATLEAHAPEEVVRKTVTVLFSDVTGSTALGERLEPESLRRVMGRYFDTVQDVLERHGGTVEKFIGDAVMAVFGVPAVREDDPVRAARAAVEMRERLADLNAELEREHGVRVLTRTGVNTGEVVVADAGSPGDQRLATGDAVNVAARLEQAAGPGEVLVGEQTYEAIRELAVVEPREPVEAKGKSEPVAAWRLIDVRADVPAFTRPIRTPFVGRRDELDRLRQAYAAAIDEKACVLVTVVGTPGIGKSRLAREFLGSIDGDARAVVGRCIAYGEGITYLPLAEIVRAVAGDDPRPRLARLLSDTDRGDVAASLVAAAVGAGDASAGSPDETAWAFRRLFEALAADRPLVVVVDDIHWAEPALLDLLEYLVGFSSGAAILLLCLTRVDLLESRPSWATPHHHATLLSLQPLDSAQAEHLLDGIRAEQHLTPELRRRIVQTAGGNPLFVEQMLAMVVDDPETAAETVPATIQALLAARLDRLPPDERVVLQRAAVEGRLFHRGAVEELLGGSAATGLGAHLLALTRKEFVRPDRSSVAGDDGFRFNHVLIRDVAYASLTKDGRADLHARLASWLERRGDDVSGRDEIVGYHLEQAYRYRTELGRIDDDSRAMGRQAGDLLALAGRRALARGEAAGAASLLGRACDLLEPQSHVRAALLPELARALREHGALERAENVVAEALDDARQRGDHLSEHRAEIERIRLRFMRESVTPDDVRATARRAIAEFGRAGSDSDLADAWQLMGIAELSAGDRAAQLQALLRGREHAIASGDTRRQIDAWNEVGGSMLFGQTPVDDVLTFLADELAWAREHGLAAVEADALLGGPYVLSRLGRFDEARDQLERSKAICRELGSAYGLAEAHAAGAQMEALAGDLDGAERELRDAIDVVEKMGAMRYASFYRTRIAHTLIAQNRDDDALAELERARELHADTATWKTARARLLARAGETADALALAREAADAVVGSDDLTLRAEILTDLAEVLYAHGDQSGAGEALAEAVRLHERKGNVLQARRCRDRLAAIGSALVE